jgi:hypothetical protein
MLKLKSGLVWLIKFLISLYALAAVLPLMSLAVGYFAWTLGSFVAVPFYAIASTINLIQLAPLALIQISLVVLLVKKITLKWRICGYLTSLGMLLWFALTQADGYLAWSLLYVETAFVLTREVSLEAALGKAIALVTK